MNTSQIVEAVLFASDAPLTPDEIARADSQLDEDLVETALKQLQAEYDDAQRAFELREVADGYQILTRSEFAPYLERFDNVPRSTRLSGPSIETLAIIAYRQPLGRLEIEYIRGVGASGVIRTLQDRNLIDIVGRSEALGRPLLYGTTAHFLEHFGFRSLVDLPRPEELPIILRDRLPLGIDGDDAEEAAQVTLALGEGEEGDAEQGLAQDAGADAEGEAVVEAGDAETAAAADADVEESSEGEEESADVEEPVIDEEPDDEEATSAPDASY